MSGLVFAKNLKWLLGSIFVGSLFLHACGRNESDATLTGVDDGLQFIAGDFPVEIGRSPGSGAGRWASKPVAIKMRLEAAAVKAYLATSYAQNKYGQEATAALGHYFANSGLAWEFDADKLLNDVPSVRQLVDYEMERAAKFVSTLDPDVTEFTSATARVSKIQRSESLNWYLAIGGFQYFITGQIDQSQIDQSRCDGSCRQARIYFHFYDRYDWDAGPVVNLQTPAGAIQIDQEHIGEFHRQGLAREFTSLGVVRRDVP